MSTEILCGFTLGPESLLTHIHDSSLLRALLSILIECQSSEMDWFGRAKIKFTSAPEAVALEEKDGSRTDLRKVCEKVTPTCQLNPLLFNGHVQTMWTATSVHGPKIYYRRRIFDADHKTYSGTFAVDFVVDPHHDTDESLPPRTAYYPEDDFAKIASDDTRPMLIVLHGLSGGSHEIYLRHAIEPLLTDGGGWAICVVNSRGCAKSSITSGVLYNARATWDIRQVRVPLRFCKAYADRIWAN